MIARELGVTLEELGKMAWAEYVGWVDHFSERPTSLVYMDRTEHLIATGIVSRTKVGNRKATMDDVAPWRVKYGMTHSEAEEGLLDYLAEHPDAEVNNATTG